MIAAALIILQAAVLPLPPVETQPPPFTRAPVADAVLAEQRGGIRLPNGIDVDLSIDTITAIDGRIVLQTVTRITEGSPVVTAYVPEGDDAVPLGQQSETPRAPHPNGVPQITYDRQNGLAVTTSMPAVRATITTGQGSTAPKHSGLRAIDLTDAATTPDGIVKLLEEGGVGGVELQGTDIRILHLTRNALGSAITNTASDRAIDTFTTVSIDLRNAGPEVVGSAMLRVEDVALGALASRF